MPRRRAGHARFYGFSAVLDAIAAFVPDRSQGSISLSMNRVKTLFFDGIRVTNRPTSWKPLTSAGMM